VISFRFFCWLLALFVLRSGSGVVVKIDYGQDDPEHLPCRDRSKNRRNVEISDPTATGGLESFHPISQTIPQVVAFAKLRQNVTFLA
jgi:hypothetical protein